MKNETIRSITRNAFVAAIYVVLTVVATPISYGMIQVRIGEALMLLCFFRKDYIYGLTIGCFIANIFSFMWADIIFGTLATFLACLCIIFSKRLLIATLFPVVFNAIIVGLELYFFGVGPFWLCAGGVALGEIVSVCVIGYTLFMLLWRRKETMAYLGINKNLEPKW